MRYHIRFRHVATSLILLIFCASLVIFLHHDGRLPQLFPLRQEPLEVSLGSGDSYQLSIGSIGRTFLGHLELFDLHVSTTGSEQISLARIGKLRSNSSLIALLIAQLRPNVIVLNLEDWHVSASLPTDSSGGISFNLQRPLSLSAKEGTVTVDSPIGLLDLKMDRLEATFSEILAIDSLQLESSQLKFKQENGLASLDKLNLSYLNATQGKLRIGGLLGPLALVSSNNDTALRTTSIQLLFEGSSLDALKEGALNGQAKIGNSELTTADNQIYFDEIEMAIASENWQQFHSSILGNVATLSIKNTQSNPLDLQIPTFNGYLGYHDEQLEGFIETEKVTLDYGNLRAELHQALLSLTFEKEYHTYALSLATGFLTDPAVRLHDSYLSMTTKPTYQELHGQFSTHLFSNVNNDTFGGEFFGQYVTNLQTLVSEMSFESRAFETSLVEGKEQLQGKILVTGNQIELLELDLEHDGGLTLHAEYSGESDEIKSTLQFDDLYLSPFKQLFERIELFPQGVIGSESSLGGTISGAIKRNWSSGNLNAQLGFAKLHLGNQELNFATTFNGSLDETAVQVEKLTLTLRDMRFEYRGIINRTLTLPEGKLSVQNPLTGEALASADFFQLDRHTYGFISEIPALKSAALSGDLTFDFEKGISSQSTFHLLDQDYHFDLQFQFQPLSLSIVGTEFSLSLLLTGQANNQLEGLLVFDELPLPTLETSFIRGEGLFSGTITFAYQFGQNGFFVQSDRLTLDNLLWPSLNRWQVESAFALTGERLELEQFTYRDQRGVLDGRLYLESESLFTLLQSSRGVRQFLLEIGSSDESIEASLYSSDDKREAVEGLIRLNDLSLNRFLPLTDELTLSLAVLGSINLPAGYIDAAATVDLSSEQEGAHVLTSEFTLQSEELRVNQLTLNFGSFSLYNTSFVVPREGAISLATNLTYTRESVWQPGLFHYSLSAQSHPRSYPTLFASLVALANIAQQEGSAVVTLTGLNQLGQSASDQLELVLSYGQRQLSLHGKAPHELTGLYDFSTKHIELYLPPSLPFALRTEGSIDSANISLGLSELKIPITYLNQIFGVPIFYFVDGIIYGDLYIEGALADPFYFGTLYSDKIDGGIFFTPDQLISLKNPVISISQNRANVGYTSLIGTTKDGKKTRGYLGIEFVLEKWSMPSISLAFLLPDEPMNLWVPLPPSSINIEAMIKGDFVITIDQDETFIAGDVIFDSGDLTFEVPPVPAWYQEPMATSLDLFVTTGKNVHFAYPSSKTPVIQALFNDNQKIYFGYDYGTNLLTFEGKPSFRSGEIYYIQKNFYITEGSLSFGRALTGSNSINAIIDMRARIREFDNSGNKVDIYLVLDNSPIDNLNPRFESLPLMTNNEILEMLGQGVLGKTTYRESGFSSVIALATVATDMISRLGIIDASVDSSFGLTPLLRQSLNLDVLTIRSNLLQNILIDALPGQSETISLSPIAKYLDNTTLYLGKYLLDNLYLQGMISLRAAGLRPTISSTFLANDIEIDTELSLEWATPLATFTLFTQPNELSVLNLLDRIGFSVTKRIAF